MEDFVEGWKEIKEFVSEEKIRAYFEEIGVVLESSKGERDWVQGKAPWHESDKIPAFLVNIKNGNWRDLRRGKSGTLIEFESMHHGISKKLAKERILDRLRGAREGLEESELAFLEQCYNEYRQSFESKEGNAVKSKTRKLGVTKEVMELLGLGFQKKSDKEPPRLVFPIKDREGRIVNLRKYSKIGSPQVKDQEGYGIPIRLYGIDEMLARPDAPVLFVGCEKDKMVAMSQFPQYVVVTTTSSRCIPPQDKSEDVWKGRKVTICVDTSVPDSRIQELAYYMRKADEKRLLRWPENFMMIYEKGDLSDFLLWEHGGVSRLKSLLENPQIIKEKDHLSSIMEELPTFLSEFERRWERKERGKLIGVDTGFPQLNKVTDGLEPGMISLFISVPGTLKTTWCKQLCDQAAERAEDEDMVFFVALEEHPRMLHTRTLARLSGYTVMDIQTGHTAEGKKVDQGTIKACLDMYSKVFKKQVMVHQAAFDERLTPALLERLISKKMQEMKATRGLLVIDPVNQLGCDDMNLDERARFNNNLRALSNMAVRLNLHIMTVVIMSRARYRKAIKEEDYNTSHIVLGRKGGSFEYDPYLLFVLDCELKNQDNWEVTLHLLENRSTGWTGKIDYVYFPANAEFEEEK